MSRLEEFLAMPDECGAPGIDCWCVLDEGHDGPHQCRDWHDWEDEA